MWPAISHLRCRHKYILGNRFPFKQAPIARQLKNTNCSLTARSQGRTLTFRGFKLCQVQETPKNSEVEIYIYYSDFREHKNEHETDWNESIIIAPVYEDDCVQLRWTVRAQGTALNIKTFLVYFSKSLTP